MLRWHVLFRTDRTLTGACRGRVLAFVERNATERLARRLCGSLGGAALVNTDVVASATQHADAGPCASCGTERPVAIAGATQSSEERIRTTEEQRAEVDGMRDFQDAIVRFVSLPRCQGLVSRPIVKAKKVEAGISEERFCDVWHVCRLVDR